MFRTKPARPQEDPSAAPTRLSGRAPSFEGSRNISAWMRRRHRAGGALAQCALWACVADLRFDFSLVSSHRHRVIFLDRESLTRAGYILQWQSPYRCLSLSLSLNLSFSCFRPFYPIHDSPVSPPNSAIRFSSRRRRRCQRPRERRKVYIKDALPISARVRTLASRKLGRGNLSVADVSSARRRSEPASG